MTSEDAARLLGWETVPDGWDFIEIHRSGQLAAFFMVKGPEIHAHRLPDFKGRWLTRQDIERVGLPILARHGCMTTAVMKTNEQGHEFVQRFGFAKTHEANGIVHYRTERLKHARL